MARGLTQRQEKFCTEYVATNRQADAYAAAYPSDKRSKKSTADLASALAKEPEIQARIAELRDKAAEKALVTVEDIAAKLNKAFDMAETLKQPGAMASAAEKLGKLYGFFVEKKDITLSMRPEEARQIIAALANKYLAGK